MEASRMVESFTCFSSAVSSSKDKSLAFVEMLLARYSTRRDHIPARIYVL